MTKQEEYDVLVKHVPGIEKLIETYEAGMESNSHTCPLCKTARRLWEPTVPFTELDMKQTYCQHCPWFIYRGAACFEGPPYTWAPLYMRILRLKYWLLDIAYRGRGLHHG